ncbi:helix-turn-helix transcriptional regulator [Cellulomonas xylanilytica]|nr:LuxR C-terminal-related transcriptional regulator [Cellulomonas xylanilytica]
MSDQLHGSARSPLLAGKLVRPAAPAALLQRVRLLELLDASADVPVTVVAAGAGWGKSTLLSSWASTTSTVASTAWVSFDHADDEPSRFWTYVATALRPVVPAASERALAALAVPQVDPLDAAVPELLNALASLTDRHALVLDDLHELGARQIHEGLELFLDYLPAGLRVLIASRGEPPLPVARLRARGRLAELGPDDLRFTRDEASTLIAGVTRSAPPTALNEILAATQGWAVGLVLEALSLRDRRGRDGVAMRSGVHHAVDYLLSEVLAGQSEERRAFLLQSAALAKMSGALCDWVLERDGSAELLTDLDRAGLFTTVIDEDREWYQYHPLFRAALLQQLCDRGRAVQLQRRAGDWYVAQGFVEEAVRALLESGDRAGAARLLSSSGAEFLRVGAVGTYLQLGEQLGEDMAARSPALALSLAWAAGSTGQLHRVPRFLELAAVGPEGESSPGFVSLRGAAAALRSVYGAGDPDAALADARAAVALETDRTLPGWVVARVALGGALLAVGDTVAALDPLDDAWRSPVTALLPAVSRLEVAGLLAWALAQPAGDWPGSDLDPGQQARLRNLLTSTGAEAQATERALGDAAAPGVGLLHAAVGQLHLESGRPGPALLELRRAGDLVAVHAHPALASLVLATLAVVEVEHGDERTARGAIERARAALADGPAVPVASARLEVAEARAGRSAADGARRVLGEQLTDRELSVLRALRGPLSQREIGRELHLSINTVKGYTKSLYRKLDVVSRSEAVAVGRELGLC